MLIFLLLGLATTGAVLAFKGREAQAAEVSPPKKLPFPTFLKNDAIDRLLMLFRGGEGLDIPKPDIEKIKLIYASVQQRFKNRQYPAISLPQLLEFYRIARLPGPSRDKYRKFSQAKVDYLSQKVDDYFEVLSAIIVGRRLEKLPPDIQAAIIPLLKKVAARIKARQPAPVRPADLALFYNVLTGKIKYA